MANTPNFSLYKPNRADENVEVDTSLADNFTKIDTELQNNKGGLTAHINDPNAHTSENISHEDGSVKTTLDNHEERLGVVDDLETRVDNIETLGLDVLAPNLEGRISTIESDVEGILAPATFDAMDQQSYTFDEYRIGYVDNKVNKNVLNKMDVFTNVDGVDCLDGTKVSAILNDPANTNKTFYLKSGNYSLVNPITITHEISLFMDDDTVITAYQAMDYMLYYSLGLDVTGTSKRKTIQGGKWDGNGLATTCLQFGITANVTLERPQISNPIAYGLDVQAGYELIVNNPLFINTLTTNIEATVGGSTIGNTAMRVNTFDGVYNDVTITNYTVGIECLKTANYFNGVHMWGNQASRLASTYNTGIIDRAGYNFFDKVYFDTFNLGYYATSAITSGTSHLSNCMFGYADNYKVVGKTPVYISNQSTKPIVLLNCGFRYDQQGGSTNTAQISTGNIDLLQYRDCDFATPATLTNIPTNKAVYAPKIYKFKFVFTTANMGTITAGGSYTVTKDLTASPYNFTGLSYEDTAVINNSLPKRGLVPYITLIDNNLYVELYNPTASSITPTSSFTVYATVIKNYDKAIIPYIQ